MDTAVPPMTTAAGIQRLASPNFVGKSQRSFWSCKNLAGSLRQETSRSAGSGAECAREFELELLLADCVCSASKDISVAGSVELSCARVATGDNANQTARMGTTKKRG